jgi:hypothetical protein
MDENKNADSRGNRRFAGCGFYWSGREDLNLRHPAPKAGALPGCATPRFYFLISASHTKFWFLIYYSNTPAFLCGMRFQAAPRPEITTLMLKLIL